MRAAYPGFPLVPGLVLLSALLGLAGFPGTASAEEVPPQELVLLNWSEYMDPEVLRAFEREAGVKVREVYFDGDDDRDALMQEREGRGFDLVVVNDVTLQTYVRRDWLAPIDFSRVPNRRHIESRWQSAFEFADTHAMPLFWGTLGIVYRADLAPQPLTRWMDLLNPVPALRGRIVMMNASRDLLGIALKALGHSANSVDPDQLAAAGELLTRQKPFVKDYYFVTLTEDSVLVTGDIIAAMVYNGDGLALQEHHEALQYLVPEEGSLLWVDYLAILASSPNKAMAHRFLDFISRPEQAAKLAEYLHYATPNQAAKAMLPATTLEDQRIYPPASVMEKLEAPVPLSAAGQRLRNEIYNVVTE